MNDSTNHEEQWWLAHLGRLLVWARLRVLESGVAEVFDCDGRTSVYESGDVARAALMDAEYRALDGMDADDAEAWGLDLEEIEPPQGDDDETLAATMMQPLKNPLTGRDL
ncbi:hypothetical protein [Arenimonas composti]|uniref:Uncharacterized protein n=1 Tax=Arenimonas composti TR7-09 = DSM 18010 TaxID=1121013 RepID=A0A091B8P6_9GAMM|nr:hypothetical protein [Arenimonas composti]KFN48993.1 hypothetical protein P873_12675 [Arenimonas composti TR7-09 = DSM 18010]